ncbi:unnamed protein product, partial [Ectocarpus sp. 8 AP-2014]
PCPALASSGHTLETPPALVSPAAVPARSSPAPPSSLTRVLTPLVCSGSPASGRTDDTQAFCSDSSDGLSMRSEDSAPMAA